MSGIWLMWLLGVAVMVVMVTEASAAVHINPALLLLLDRFTPESSTGLGHDGLGAAVEVIGRVCEGAGLHRTMVTRLVVPEQHGGGGVVVAERITRDMYVDLDQVSVLEEFGGPKVLASRQMDVEKPAAAAADEQVVLVYARLASGGGDRVISMELPVHFRYQSPSQTQYQRVVLPHPLFLLDSVPVPVPEDQTGHDSKGHPFLHTLPCNATTTQHCTWREHRPLRPRPSDHLAPNTSSPTLHVDIPCGLLSDTPVVVVGTALSSLAGVVCLMHTMLAVDLIL